MKDQNQYKEAISSPLQLLELNELRNPGQEKKSIITYMGEDPWGRNEIRGYDLV